MMRFLIFAVFLAFLSIDSTSSTKCMSSYDCGTDECCLDSKILGMFRRGDCAPMSKEDEPCSPDDYEVGIIQRKYIGSCPCAPGLSCQTTKEKKLPFGVVINYDERCVPDTSTTIAKSTPEDVTTNADLKTEETEVVTAEEITDAPTDEEDDLDATASPEDEGDDDELVVTSVPEEFTSEEVLETEIVTEEEENTEGLTEEEEELDLTASPEDDDEDGKDVVVEGDE